MMNRDGRPTPGFDPVDEDFDLDLDFMDQAVAAAGGNPAWPGQAGAALDAVPMPKYAPLANAAEAVAPTSGRHTVPAQSSQTHSLATHQPFASPAAEPTAYAQQPVETQAFGSLSQASADTAEPMPLTASAIAPQASASEIKASEPVAAAPAAAFVPSDQRDISIPRIAIHVFTERQDTQAAAERAGQDRRLARAATHVRAGGVPAAIATYQGEPTPPLIIVECLQDPQGLLAEIDRLAEVCDAGTKVVVIGPTNDILLYRELIRRGVSEYLVAPIQPLQLISAIGGLFNDPAQPFVGRTIAFIGARGGAGSSTVAHNAAYAISEKIGANTVIVDYDLPFGTAGLDFNQDPINGVADALSQPERLDATLLDRMLVRCTDKLSLFAAPATLDGDWDISADAFEEVTAKIRSTAPFVVLDLPHMWSAWVRRTLVAADEVVVVATPDLASLRNAKNMIDLIRQARPNDAPPRLVLNQVGVPGRPEIPAKDFGTALGVHPSLTIPFDARMFGVAANNGQMILDAAAKSKAAEAFELLGQIVSQRELPAVAAKAPGKSSGKAGGDSLFGKLFKKS